MTLAATSDLDRLERKIDALTTHVEVLLQEAQADAARRERWEELAADLSPVAEAGYRRVAQELADLSGDVSIDDVVGLLRRVAADAEMLEQALIQLESLSELTGDISHLSTHAFQVAAARLDEYYRKGYFTFASEGLAVVDRVVTTYDEDDIRALGDNIVLILDTVRQMTQPEVMMLLRQTVSSVEEADVADVSMWQLARQMRDPEVKRGIARLLAMLRTMGHQRSLQQKGVSNGN